MSQWTLGVKRADGGWAVIGWNDLVARLRELDLADAMVVALAEAPDPDVQKLWEDVERELRRDKDRRASPRPNPPPPPAPKDSSNTSI